jgi:hypothetical protein
MENAKNLGGFNFQEFEVGEAKKPRKKRVKKDA